MKLPIIAACISALILVGCAHQREESAGAGGPGVVSETGQSGSYLGDQEQTFLKESSQAGLMEVQMGRLAAQKGQSSQVRQLGQKLVQDHSKANQELKLLAAQKQIVLPTDLKTEHQAMISHLKSLEGAEFDEAFKKHALEHHQEDVQKFQTASQQAADSDVKAFAQKTLPVLQQHLKMTQDIQAVQTEAGLPATSTQSQSGSEASQQPSQSPQQP